MKNKFMWFFAIITIVSSVLNIFKNEWGFVLWFMADIAFSIQCYKKKDYPQLCVWIFYTLLCIYGFLTWRLQ